MPEEFEVRTEAERYIHNDLSNCAWELRERMKGKFESGETAGVYHDMMASLVFCAFAIEAKVNFVGWKTLKNGWPERATLKEKIDLLNEVLDLDLTRGAEPLQTISTLRRFRDTIAHGKPEIVDEVRIVDHEPEIWDSLSSQWERSVNREFVDRSYEGMNTFWRQLLDGAEINIAETVTRANQSLRARVEERNIPPAPAKDSQR